MYTHPYMYRHTDTCTYTHVHTYKYTCTQPYRKLQYFVTFTHRAGYCTLGGGREHSTLLRLLSLCSTFEQSDGSQWE
ncbi:unnamed protein product [Staurois parvus]|uniref:Uncharacterized protein n=1 Tax=Staurois parvus TaxID=386267 RepID=A0ABN9G9P8_9NEOB|nr:unnamed protein product [Staurois parvus]